MMLSTTITNPWVLLQIGTVNPSALATVATGPEMGLRIHTKIMVPTTREMTLGRKMALL